MASPEKLIENYQRFIALGTIELGYDYDNVYHQRPDVNAIALLFEHPSLITAAALEIREQCRPGYNELDAALPFAGHDIVDKAHSIQWYINIIRLLTDLDEFPEAEILYAKAVTTCDEKDPLYLTLRGLKPSFLFGNIDPESKLPPELFEQVLSFLSRRELDLARRTSRAWNTSISKVRPFWREIWLTATSKYEDPASTETREELRIETLKTAGPRLWTFVLGVSVNLDWSLPQHLVSHCPRVREVYVRDASIDTTDPAPPSADLNLYLRPLFSLELLHKLDLSWTHAYEGPVVIQSIHKFKALQSLCLTLENLPENDWELPEIGENLSAAARLVTLELCVKQPESMVREKPNLLNTLTSLVLRCPKLESLTIKFWRYALEAFAPEVMSRLAETHPNLEKASFEGLWIVPFRLNNMKSLALERCQLDISSQQSRENLSLAANLQSMTFWDCGLHSVANIEDETDSSRLCLPRNTQNLTFLKIGRSTEIIGRYYLNKICATSTPSLLKMHEFFWDGFVVNIDDQETRTIVAKFPNLEDCTFYRQDAITENGLWATVLRCPLLKRLQIRYCDNIPWDSLQRLMQFKPNISFQYRYRQGGPQNF